MQRQKNEEELRQEAEDAAMARRLQEEFAAQEEAQRVAEQAQHQQQRGSQQATTPSFPTEGSSPAAGAISVACPACTFINEIKNPLPGKRYGCVQCRTPLPVNVGPSKSMERRRIECKVCHAENVVPDKKGDALLCGACFQQLGTAPHPADQAPTERTRTVQVRCGQCMAVNAVEVSVNAKLVQFECGGCKTINETSLA